MLLLIIKQGVDYVYKIQQTNIKSMSSFSEYDKKRLCQPVKKRVSQA